MIEEDTLEPPKSPDDPLLLSFEARVMKLSQPRAEIFVPDGLPVKKALARTTHMAIGAHPDDLELMAAWPILECFQNARNWFCGVTLTNGGGRARAHTYARYTDRQLERVRRKEQNKAALIGEYSAMVHLAYPSTAIKTFARHKALEDLKKLLFAAAPECLFTHNLADKHDTHVATAVLVIYTVRQLPAKYRPKALYGCELWRSLDWMLDKDKAIFDVSSREHLTSALIGVFDSQIGRKRYNLAAMGRKCANATYLDPHTADHATALEYSMDLTPLIHDSTLDLCEYIRGYTQRFAADVRARISKFIPLTFKVRKARGEKSLS